MNSLAPRAARTWAWLKIHRRGVTQWVLAITAVTLAMTAAWIWRVDLDEVQDSSESVLPQRGLRVAMVHHGGIADPFWEQVRAGAVAGQREFGVDLEYRGSGIVTDQAAMVDQVVAEGADVLVVSLADPDAMERSVRDAVSAGLTVMTINSGEERGREFGAVTHFGQPDWLAGLASGERLVQLGVRRLLCVIHELGNVGLNSRCENASIPMSRSGGRAETFAVTGTSDRVLTVEEIQAKLLAEPDIDGVLTLNSTIGELAAIAIEGAGSSARLATFDISEWVLEQIEDGNVLFAVDQNPYMQGFLPIVAAYAMAEGEAGDGAGVQAAIGRWAAEGRIFTGPGFVDGTNVKVYAALAPQAAETDE